MNLDKRGGADHSEGESEGFRLLPTGGRIVVAFRQGATFTSKEEVHRQRPHKGRLPASFIRLLMRSKRSKTALTGRRRRGTCTAKRTARQPWGMPEDGLPDEDAAAALLISISRRPIDSIPPASVDS